MAQDGSVTYKEALQDCKKYAQRIAGVVDKVIPPPKKDVKKDKKSLEKSSSETSHVYFLEIFFILKYFFF